MDPILNQNQKIVITELSPDKCSLNIFYSTEFIYQSLQNELNQFINYLINLPYLATEQSNDSFNVVETVYFSDGNGEWSYQPLQNQLQITISLLEPGQFPPFVKLPSNIKVNFICNQKIFEFNNNSEQTYTKIEELIQKIGQKYCISKDDQESIIGEFKEVKIQTIDDLYLLSKEDWNSIAGIEVIHKQYIKIELKQQSRKVLQQEKNQFSKAEINAKIHCIKRYLIWRINNKNVKALDNISYIYNDAARQAFAELQEEYQGPELLKELENYFQTFTVCKSHSKNLQYSRGIILYGPPGTGKTQITSRIASLLGFTPIGPDICSSDVNKSLVGQTEELLRNLMNRARKLPYLMCSLSIDEIDTLAGKRDDKQNEHKTDHLTTLLGVIGGITDVPNIILFTATNNFNKIDPAFVRRLSGTFFVGIPSPESRKKIFLSEKESITKINRNNIDSIVKMTTNFSGLNSFFYQDLLELK